jgi:catechol 2,3-dioxygenase-like lactoylglutathione lyase family enzyme
MISRFDHVTIVVQDVERAKRFFGLLGFEEAIGEQRTGKKVPFSLDVHTALRYSTRGGPLILDRSLFAANRER